MEIFDKHGGEQQSQGKELRKTFVLGLEMADDDDRFICANFDMRALNRYVRKNK